MSPAVQILETNKKESCEKEKRASLSFIICTFSNQKQPNGLGGVMKKMNLIGRLVFHTNYDKNNSTLYFETPCILVAATKF